MKKGEGVHQEGADHVKKSINYPEDQITTFHRHGFLSKNLKFFFSNPWSKIKYFLIHST